MDINLGEIAVQIAIVIAIVNYVKTASPKILGYWAALVAIGVSFIVVMLNSWIAGSIVLVNIVRDTFIIGLAASGIYDLRQGK